jgi:nucleoside-diphosphate-sugar epimerase
MPRCKFAAWLSKPASRVAVVGASGWVGMALTDQVLAACPDLSVDRLRLFGSRPRTLGVSGRTLEIQRLDEASTLGEGEWLVLHAAIIGADRVEGGDLNEIRRRNDTMLNLVLTLCETGQTRRLVAVSSGAAALPDAGGPARQAYGRLKHEHEIAVADWSARTGRAVLVPRIFSLGGPYINHTSAYALGDFTLQQARTRRIAIGAAVPVIRSFVHVLDGARAMLTMAVDEAEGGAPFDVCLGRELELRDLALAVAAAFGDQPVIDRPPVETTGGDRYVGQGDRFQAALARDGHAPAPFDQIVRDTITYLREVGEIPASADDT